MQQERPTIRRHAIFKREYRRAAAAEDFQNMTPAAQWALLRGQVLAGASDGQSTLLDLLDSREPRRDEVLSRLEDGRRQDVLASRRAVERSPLSGE